MFVGDSLSVPWQSIVLSTEGGTELPVAQGIKSRLPNFLSLERGWATHKECWLPNHLEHTTIVQYDL